MREKELADSGYFAVFFIVLIAIIGGISITTSDVAGTNITNATVITIVNVTNTEPVLYAVQVTPSSIDLNPGGTVNVTCNASVYDYNGGNDVRNVSAMLYHFDYGSGASGDNNYRYVNTSCTNSSGGANCQIKDGSANNVSCTCTFAVWYYAYNGTWQCNMSVRDQFGLNSSRVSNATMNTVVGITVPSEIDFGNLSVTEISNYVRENVTNWGNADINVSVRGYGGSADNNNLSMVCQYGNISNTYMRYALANTTSYANMINITNISTNVQGLQIPSREDDAQYGNSTNATFWKLEVPLSVGGYCNGTVVFSAAEVG